MHTHTITHTHTHTLEVGGERGGHMQQSSSNIIHPVFIYVSWAHRSPYWWARRCISVTLFTWLHTYTHTHTHTHTHTQEHTIKNREWRQLRAFCFFFFCLCSFFTSYSFFYFLHLLFGWWDDSEKKKVGRGRLRRTECRERAGREEERLFRSLWTVITTYSCFLPGAPTGHQQREGGRE